MKVEHLELLVEEPSAEEVLRALLPKMLGDDPTFAIHPFQGKAELLKELAKRLAGYARWLPSTWRILVVVDRDADDCRELKRRLDEIALAHGLKPKSAAHAGDWTVMNRLAIEELEAWFFGDWEAVRAAYPRVGASVPRQAKYRHPDEILGGTWEAFERILRRARYFETGLRKLEAARAIAPHMHPESNGSPSFQALRRGLLALRSIGGV